MPPFRYLNFMKNDTRVRVARYQPAAVLRVTGEDALAFLQGQFTQDLKAGGVGAAAYGLWLNQKGKVLADSFVLRARDGVCWVVSYFSAAAAVRERLESYVIADDVVIEDQTSGWEGMVIAGAGAEAWLAANGPESPVAGKFAEVGSGLIWQGRRSKEVSWEWLRPKEEAWSASGAEELSAAELERQRIDSGIPAVPRDVGPGDLPNEAGLERDAISFTKGCYLGQEVMARLKTMGQVRRRLVRVEGRNAAGVPQSLPAALFLGEKRVGEVRSAIAVENGWIGLAMVMLFGLGEGAGLSLASGGAGDVRVEVPTHD
jgi:folate-binding protein YgfZ